MSDSKLGLRVMQAYFKKNIPDIVPVELSKTGASVKLRHNGYEGWVPIATVLSPGFSLRTLHLRGQ